MSETDPLKPILDDDEIPDKPVSKRKLWFKGLLAFAAFAFGFIFGAIIVFLVTKGSVTIRQATQAPTSPIDLGDTCKISIIGSGWGGVYFAYRTSIDTQKFSPQDICIFEASKRIGGRTYSIYIDQVEGLVLDLGASKYLSTQELISGLIEKSLQLKTSCYDCDNQSQNQSRIIVDDQGFNIGFGSGISSMLSKFEAAGGRMFYEHKLVKIDSQNGNSPLKLIFENGNSFSTQRTILNIPSSALSDFDPTSLLYTMASETTKDSFISPTSKDTIKYYLVYEDAWWKTKLGRTTGDFFSPTFPPLRGSYGDGQVICKDEVCQGAILVSFSQNRIEVDYYKNFHHTYDPLAIISPSSNRDLMLGTHKALIALNQKEFDERGISTESIDEPLRGYFALWYEREDQRQYPGLHYFSCDNIEGIQESVVKPLNDFEIYVINEAWTSNSWVEGVLVFTEKVLSRYFELSPPIWINQTYLNNF